MKKVSQLLKKLKEVIRFPYKPRSEENKVWKEIQLRQARHYFEKGFYSKKEYKRKVEEINQKYDQIKSRKN